VDAPLPPGSRPSLRLVVNLNAALHAQLAAERAAAEVIGPDVAHHLVDPDGLLGLDPLRATELDDGFARLLAAEPDRWLLALPVPGALGPLRGPVELNTAALAAGEAAVAASGGVALVPHRVGPGVQWRVHAAARPFAPPTLYEAERQLSEAVLRAATTLTHLDVASGTRPRAAYDGPALAPGYPPRARLAADRAARLLAACDEALTTDGAAITLHEAEVRSRELRVVRTAAGQALCAAAGWPEV
jgi:hypothetical protein